MTEEKAKWTTAYINNLKDAAFAYTEPGGKKNGEGKTVPRSLRHFPHHNSGVKVGTEHSSVDILHLRNALARVPQSPFGSKALPHLKRHAKALGVGEKAETKSQYGFATVENKEGRRIIAGYGSYIMIDSDDQLITQEALTKGLAKFMADKERRNIMSSHDNVQIGKVLDDFGEHETHVDDIGLYIVGEIYDDLKTTEDVWQDILDEKSNAFSISFEPLKTAEHVIDGVWEEVGLLNLIEVSVCENPKNPLSRFIILTKSQNVKKIKKGEIMTEEELKLKQTPEEKDEIVESINDELNKLKLLGEEIKADDLSNLAKLVTTLRTGGEKSYQFPEKACRSEGDRWSTVIANAIDDLYTKLSEFQPSEKSVKELKATVIKKSADADLAKKEAEDAKKKAEDAKKTADEAEKKAEGAKKDADEVKDTATKDRELLGTVQESLKNLNDTVTTFDERLQKLENQKEVKTKASKEDLIKEYKSPNVIEKPDGVEIMVGE